MHFFEYRHKYPFIRFLVPLIIGIYLCEHFYQAQEQMWSMGSCLLFVSTLFVCLAFSYKKYSYRWLWGAGIYLFFLSLGILITAELTKQTLLPDQHPPHVYIARVSDQPLEKAKTIRCPVSIEEYRNTKENYPCHFNVLLYLPKDSLSHQVNRGDKLLFYSKISPPSNNGNPEEFDYASYLFHQGVSGVSWVKTGEWKIMSVANSFDLKQKADSFREKILNLYRSLGFKSQEFAILSALTLGYKAELVEETKQAFSVAGVSHVLALSGLHIGLIYVMLNFLLTWFDRSGRFKLIKPLLIIVCLWVFAFITGLSPSVIRSTIMFSLLTFSTFFSGRVVTLNTLAVAAFFMLLYNPFYLFDVSFQLSFVSVAGIVVIQPWLYRQWILKNPVAKYVWGLITVTLAAQIVTTPLILYYFSTFPVHFLWTNLLVIPMVTFILYLAVWMLLSGWFPAMQVFVADVLKKMLCYLNDFTSLVERLPVSSIKNIHLNEMHVVGFFLFLFFLALYLNCKNKKYLYASLVSVWILAIVHLQEKTQQTISSSILFYNNPSASCVHFISTGEKSYLLSARNECVMDNLKHSVSRFWASHQISTPIVLPENYLSAEISNNQGIANFSGKKVCLVKDDRWRNKKLDHPLFLDYLYICNGYKGSIANLMELFTIRKVILDSSLSDYRLERFKKECKALALDFISISEKGSYRIEL